MNKTDKVLKFLEVNFRSPWWWLAIAALLAVNIISFGLLIKKY